jgi:acetylornithine deacetylase/succinyl-diaminopimelate desuccinylase-like protein
MTPDERERLFALLRIPSVSAVAEHAPDMDRAVELLAQEIARAGGTSEVVRNGGHPLLIGDVPAGVSDAPRVIVYGHYDVQPVGDRAAWLSDPFAPEIRDGNLYGRGASDDKGNLFMLVAAVQRLAADGPLPVHVRLVIDGEEECGGESAVRFVADDSAPADAAVIFDAPMIGPGRPMICAGLRGLVYRRVQVRTAPQDAHSGLYGGAGLNAAHVLVRVLDQVIAHDGVLHPDLCVGIAEPSPDERAAWADLPTGAQMLADAGLVPADARAAAEFYRRTVAAPSLEIHGISCGEPTAVKTNLVSVATATLSLRVAPGQDAHGLAASLDRLILAAAPDGAEVGIEPLGVADPALCDPRDPVLRAASQAIAASTGWPCVPVRSGGSIPIVATLAGRGIPTVLSGFALPDDGIHGPNEHLRVDHLELGTSAAMAIFAAIGKLGR